MTRILVYEPAFRRIEDRLPAAAKAVEFVLLAPDSTLSLNGRAITSDEAAPEAGWMSVDMFSSPAFREWFAALQKTPELKWVQSAAAGFDDPMFKRLVSKGARLTTSSAQGVSMAEYVLWGVLDHFQRGPERRAGQAAGQWTRLPFRDVAGSRWLIVGFGAIGQATAVRAKAFDAHVTGVRRSPAPHPAADAMATPDDLLKLLPDSDVVVLSLPLGPATAGMVDATFLSAMKSGSMLVNVGRGGLVDETALLAALDSGKPAHALLDVFRQEPLPAQSPFYKHPRVSLTGHASPLGSGLTSRGDALFLDNLQRYLTGEPLRNEARREDVLAE